MLSKQSDKAMAASYGLWVYILQEVFHLLFLGILFVFYKA